MYLSIILVNYNNAYLTKQFNYSVKAQYSKIKMEFILIDNNSTDDSKQAVTTEYPEVNWIELTKNIGFGQANNIGVRNTSSKYILLLNSDIIIKEVIEDCLDYLITNSKF